MSSDINQLIHLAQSADNNERNNAESTLLNACDSDASMVLNALMTVAVNSEKNNPLASRQFALLTVRKLITFYWSPAFESYRNTSSLNEESKDYIRDSLLKLCLDPEQDKKISNGASYCIVQIAAVDFPDQWPQLLEQLYAGIINAHSLNAMSVFNEIYDDVISEEMFFEGGIGTETLNIVSQLLNSPDSSLDAKTAAMKLFNASLLQMSTVTSNATHERKSFVQDVVPKSLEALLQLLQNYINIFDQAALQLKSKIYENLTLIKNDFPKKLFPHQAVTTFKQQSINDLATLKDWSLTQDQEDESLWQTFNESTIQTLEFLSSISDNNSFSEEENTVILQSMLTLSCLDNATRVSWLDDPNEFVSKETGLTASYTIRDQVAEYLGNLSGSTLQNTFETILEFINVNMNRSNPKLMESALYMLQSVLVEDEEGVKLPAVQEFERFIDTIFNYQLQTNDVSLSMRIILTIPKILDVFMGSLPNVKAMTKNYLSKSIELAINVMNQNDDKLIMSAVLIAFTYYAYFAELSSVLGNELCLQVQTSLLNIVNHVAEDAEEDTNGLLIEVLNNIISANTPETDFKVVRQQFTSVLSISAKDPSNIQIVVESQECLEKLLANINTERYSAFIELCLPSFIHIIQGTEVTGYKYSPLLSLILEFITVFMKKKPTDGPLPAKFAEYIWEPLIRVLKTSIEDETLQLATDAFTYLIHNTEANAMVGQLPTIVDILDRLLSIDVSDTAAMNVGSLIVTICNKFSNEISDLIPQILKAAVTRLIQVKNVSTQENLVSLLCFLMYSDPLQTLNFLFQVSDEENRNVVQLTFNKWFESFEIVRGERRIKDNVIALSKLFFLSDPRLNEITVNNELIPYDGDLIITRSMAKSMPDRYTQVSVNIKIVKLFCHELEFRTRQPDTDQLITNNLRRMGDEHGSDEGDEVEGDGDDEDWEDVDDVLDYEKLKEFVDDDEDDVYDDEEADPEQSEAQEITGIADVPQSLVQLLIEFFKEVMTKNVNDFQSIYNSLNETEKATLTQQLV
ncbi:importin subunit beta-5 [Monosporozyma servazzii]